MTRTATQFCIALVLSLGLVIAAVCAVVAEVFFDGRSELTLALITALAAGNGQAVAFLFRVNGAQGGP